MKLLTTHCTNWAVIKRLSGMNLISRSVLISTIYLIRGLKVDTSERSCRAGLSVIDLVTEQVGERITKTWKCCNSLETGFRTNKRGCICFQTLPSAINSSRYSVALDLGSNNECLALLNRNHDNQNNHNFKK